MDNLRERIDSALRFTPDRIYPIISNLDFKPWFVRYGAFVYKRESFDENDKKIKSFHFVDLTCGEDRELFDHKHLAGLLKEKTGTEYDPTDLPLTPVRVTRLNAFVFSLPDQSRWLYDGKNLAKLIPALPMNAVIAPDGKKAVYEGDGDLYLVKLPSMETTRLTTDGTPDRGYGTRLRRHRRQAGRHQAPHRRAVEPRQHQVLHLPAGLQRGGGDDADPERPRGQKSRAPRGVHL